MIYTPDQIIDLRDARKGRKFGPAGENAAAGDLWICVKTAVKTGADGA